MLVMVKKSFQPFWVVLKNMDSLVIGFVACDKDYRRQGITKNLMGHFEAKAKEMQVLTKEEMQRFIIQAKADGYFELFILELCTGMRRGEIAALQWKDLNMQTGELHICRQVTVVKGASYICTPKTKSSIRTVILPPDIVRILAEYKKRINSRWMRLRSGWGEKKSCEMFFNSKNRVLITQIRYEHSIWSE